MAVVVAGAVAVVVVVVKGSHRTRIGQMLWVRPARFWIPMGQHFYRLMVVVVVAQNRRRDLSVRRIVTIAIVHVCSRGGCGGG